MLIQRIIDFFVCKSYASRYISGKNHKYYKIITQTKLQRVPKEIQKKQKIFGSNKGHFVMYRGRGRFSFYSGGWTKRRKIERLPQ